MFKNQIAFFIGFCCFTFMNAQKVKINSKYFEDQLFFGISYNTLENTPEGFQQNGFSYGLSFGFIKDIPWNEQRNIGMGIGFGFSFDTYNQNLLVNNEAANDVFSISNDYDSNHLKINSIDIPFEFRWRTSTLVKYKFWRIYTGVKFSYLISHQSKFKFNELSNIDSAIDGINRFQYGVYTSLGYNTWNFYVHYSITPIFDNSVVTDGLSTINLNPLKLGLVFYLL